MLLSQSTFAHARANSCYNYYHRLINFARVWRGHYYCINAYRSHSIISHAKNLNLRLVSNIGWQRILFDTCPNLFIGTSFAPCFINISLKVIFTVPYPKGAKPKARAYPSSNTHTHVTVLQIRK